MSHQPTGPGTNGSGQHMSPGTYGGTPQQPQGYDQSNAWHASQVSQLSQNMAWPAGTGTHAAPANPAKSIVLVLLGMILVLGIIGAAAVGFFMARADDAKAPVAQAQKIQQPAPVRNATGQSKLVVHAYPEGTQLLVNGRVVTNNAGSKGVEVDVQGGGSVKVELTRAGYRNVLHQLSVGRGTTQHLHVNLQPLPAGVAAVQPATPTPAPQSKASTSKRSSKKYASRRYSRKSSSSKKSAPARQAKKPGALTVRYSPSNAKFFLNNSPRAGGSPMRLAGLAPGSYSVRLQAAGYATLNHTVTVSEGGDANVSLQLRKQSPSMGTVDIVTAPAGATITVNGSVKGQAPLIGFNLAPGKRYRISAKKDGYRVASSTVSLKKGHNRPVVLSLSPVATTSSAAPAQPQKRVAPLRVARAAKGSAARGKSLFSSRCGSCHGNSVKSLSPASRTAAQWSRYLASGRHAYRQPLRGKVSLGELKHVKAYLMANAADAERAVAAGVR